MSNRQAYIEQNLFYTIPSNQTGYTTEPTSIISIDKVLQGDKDCWETAQTTQSGTRAKKKIIVTDFLLSTGGKKRIKLLEELLADGFEIYFMGNQALIPIKTTSEISKNYQAIKPVYQDEAIEFAIKNKINRHECFIMDGFKMDQFINDNFETNKITVEEIVEYQYESWYPDLVRSIRNLNHVILVFDPGKVDTKSLRTLMEASKNNLLGYDIYIDTSYEENFTDLLSPQIEYLALEDWKGYFSSQQIETFFPNLKTLHYQGAGVQQLIDKPITLPELEVLDIELDNTAWGSINKALNFTKHANHLKELNVFAMEEMVSEEKLVTLEVNKITQYSQLQKLTIHTVNPEAVSIDIADLYVISLCCQSLEFLEIRNLHITNRKSFSPPTNSSFCKLKTLFSTINYQKLIHRKGS